MFKLAQTEAESREFGERKGDMVQLTDKGQATRGRLRLEMGEILIRLFNMQVSNAQVASQVTYDAVIDENVENHFSQARHEFNGHRTTHAVSPGECQSEDVHNNAVTQEVRVKNSKHTTEIVLIATEEQEGGYQI